MSPAEGPRIEHRIRLDADGGVTAFSGKVDFGQGIRTALTQVVAEELDVPFETVRLVMGETDVVPFDAGTWHSDSVHLDGAALRRAAAAARQQLVARASARLGLDPAALETTAATVRARRDGSAVTYAELAAEGPLTGPIADEVRVKAPADMRVIGTSLRRIEAPDLVSGRATFVADVRLPGMLRGAMLRPPVRGAVLRSLDDRAARAMPGVVAVVRDGDIVAVVADRQEHAVAGVAALVAEWKVPEPSRPAREVNIRAEGDVDGALATAAKRLEVIYTLPYISNAPIGPSAAVADVREGQATIYTASQTPFTIRREVARLLDLPEERVSVIPRRSSGTYGRNGHDDAPVEAARLSRAVGRPVLVQWTREEEFAHGSNRPEARIEATAALDADGNIVAWRYRIHTNVHIPDHFYTSVEHQAASFGASEGALPAYRIPAVEADLHLEIAPIRTAAFRSLGGAENVFAVESLMDELAALAGEDPLAFRSRHLSDPRMRGLLELVAERTGWADRPRGGGRGFGLACGSFAGPSGTQVAQVASVTVDPRGRVRIERLWCAIDPGLVVNPDGVRNQIEGAMQQAASIALIEEVRHRDGRVVTTGWDTYPIATFRDAPAMIEVLVVGDPTRPSTGVGEVGTVPVAAAIANAVFAASGARVRDLPITAAKVRAALATAKAGGSLPPRV